MKQVLQLKLSIVIVGVSSAVKGQESIQRCEKEISKIPYNTYLIPHADDIKELENYKDLCSHNGVYQKALSFIYLTYRMNDDAISFLEKEIPQATYDTKELKYDLALAYVRKGYIPEAINLADEVLENHPEWPFSYSIHRLISIEKKLCVKSIFYFKKSLKPELNNVTSFFLLTTSSYMLENFENSVVYFEHAERSTILWVDNYNVSANFYAIMAYARLNIMSKIQNCLLTLKRFDPESITAKRYKHV